MPIFPLPKLPLPFILATNFVLPFLSYWSIFHCRVFPLPNFPLPFLPLLFLPLPFLPFTDNVKIIS